TPGCSPTPRSRGRSTLRVRDAQTCSALPFFSRQKPAYDIHRTLEPCRADDKPYPAGTDVILLAQPYRAYVKTLLERQDYPVRRVSPGGPPELPYDVAGWTLPAQMGIDVRTIERAFEAPATSRVTTATIPPARGWSDRTPGSYVV